MIVKIKFEKISHSESRLKILKIKNRNIVDENIKKLLRKQQKNSMKQIINEEKCIKQCNRKRKSYII